MVAINFQERFADQVQLGLKCQTIRKKARCKPGDMLQLYTGQRTERCRLLRETICQKVTPVEVHIEGIKIDGQYIDDDTQFAKADGFEDYSDLWIWFKNTHNLNYETPFEGYLIQW